MYNGGDYRHQGDSGVRIINIVYFTSSLHFQASFVNCSLSFRTGGHILLLHLNSPVAGIRRRMLWP